MIAPEAAQVELWELNKITTFSKIEKAQVLTVTIHILIVP